MITQKSYNCKDWQHGVVRDGVIQWTVNDWWVGKVMAAQIRWILVDNGHDIAMDSWQQKWWQFSDIDLFRQVAMSLVWQWSTSFVMKIFKPELL